MAVHLVTQSSIFSCAIGKFVKRRRRTWKVKVDDVGDVVDVDAARRDVGGDQDPDFARLEIQQGLLSVGLLAVAMDALTVDP